MATGGSEGRLDKKQRSETEHSPGDDLARLLPNDVLDAVVRRLAPRWVAACRCVCRAWRDIIDAHRLLRADLLPVKLAGIFVSFDYRDFPFPDFLARPSAAPTMSGWPNSLPTRFPWWNIGDHCNGLLLIDYKVVNPATRWWAQLPFSTCEPEKIYYDYEVRRLLYDPTLSPHFHVLIIPRFLDLLFDEDPRELDPAIEQSEWPPLLYTLEVFSSRTGQWEERSFAREGEVAGTLADMRSGLSQHDIDFAVCWREALYVYSQSDYIMRISLSNDKYHVIKSPADVSECHDFYLGKSRHGVYFATLDAQCWLQVWRLKESCAKMEWVLIHCRDLKPMVPCRSFAEQIHGSWILQRINYNDEHQKTVYSAINEE
ncbi:hypothetical protein EJB05_05248, partial [Eragrostis curvula]